MDSQSVTKAKETIERFNSFAERVEAMDLYDVGDATPLLDVSEPILVSVSSLTIHRVEKS